jgi:hypothetical protein
MDNLEKLATFGTQDKQNKKHNTICVGQHYTQRNTNNKPGYNIYLLRITGIEGTFTRAICRFVIIFTVKIWSSTTVFQVTTHST